MEQDEYISLCKKYSAIEMVRPFWTYHHEWKDITVLICQRKTKILIQLCLESLLTFYPDIPVLVVDGNSQDDSTFYLRYKSLICPNVKLWEREKVESKVGNSHGQTMHEAITNYIKTKYFLLLDSDTIIKRAGFIEGMISKYENPKLYATGTVILVTNKNDGCGLPNDENDILFYPHPSCSIYKTDIYKELKPFTDHGAPCVYNIQDAIKEGWEIETFPVNEYIIHLSGASWTTPRTIWINDFDVLIRPFISFIINNGDQFIQLTKQDNQDFEIITLEREKINNVVIHSLLPVIVKNRIFDIRFHVHGEYVCHIKESVERIDYDFVSAIINNVIKNNAPDELNVGGLWIVKRKIWQANHTLQ